MNEIAELRANNETNVDTVNKFKIAAGRIIIKLQGTSEDVTQ